MNQKKTSIDWRIFRKATIGTLNKKEQADFDNWLNADAQNRAYYNKAVTHYNNSNTTKADYKPAFNQFVKNSSAKKTATLRWIQVAASVAILICGAWLAFWLTNTTTKHTIAKVSPKQIHEGKVELVLSTGKKVLLDKNGANVIKEQATDIIQKNGVVDYRKKQNNIKKIQYNTIKVPRGTDFKLVLSDGSTVWLNAESSITYPIQFIGSTRKVKITGEAYLKVSHNKTKPFIVATNDTEIKVLGTEFNVNTYSQERGVITTLVAGSVAVKSSTGKQVIIKPNQQAINRNGELQTQTADINKVLSWRKGIFEFEDESLNEILKELARWYDFNIVYTNDSLRNFQFTGNLDRYDDMNKLLQLFEMTKAVKFYMNGKTLVVKKPTKK